MRELHHERIALCLRWGIGDVVMQTPALAALRAAAPGASITALGAAPAVELLSGDPRVDDVVAVQRFGIRHLWDEPGAADGHRLEDFLRHRNFDLVLDPHAAAAALGRVLWALGAECRESDQRAEARVLSAGGSGSAALAAGARAGWGVPVPADARPALRLDPAAATWAEQMVRRLTAGVRTRPIAVAPFASHALKRWPADRFGALINRIPADRHVFLLQAPDDNSATLARAATSRGRVHMIPPQPLTRLAALLARCETLVCNDTGVMHIAAAVGTATVAVFGPSDPEVYAPRGSRHRVACAATDACPHRLQRRLAFPPCGAHEQCLLGERSCVDRVAMQDVGCELAASCGRARARLSRALPS